MKKRYFCNGNIYTVVRNTNVLNFWICLVCSLDIFIIFYNYKGHDSLLQLGKNWRNNLNWFCHITALESSNIILVLKMNCIYQSHLKRPSVEHNHWPFDFQGCNELGVLLVINGENHLTAPIVGLVYINFTSIVWEICVAII